MTADELTQILIRANDPPPPKPPKPSKDRVRRALTWLLDKMNIRLGSGH